MYPFCVPMKKFTNAPADSVLETISGFAAAHADLVSVRLDSCVAYRATGLVQGKVGLISGGGFGHEPMHFGFVGVGALDAACVGTVFSSPTTTQILEAVEAADADAGVLLIVKNYAGDVLNFKVAFEMANSPLEFVLVADDCSFTPQAGRQGRRGMGATVFVHKIAGALAETGASLSEVAEVARKVVAATRSFGVALESCVTPNTGQRIFTVAEDEIEFGVGIHGERGVRREKWLPAHELVHMMLEPVLSELQVQDNDEVLVLVNGLGATPIGELYLVFNEVNMLLGNRGVRVKRSLVGSFLTSLDMAGASISVLKLDASLLALWDAPVCTPVLRWGQ
jgi:phosphoenolpyruvate---glycerone phosphotransferase subunit DhaK